MILYTALQGLIQNYKSECVLTEDIIQLTHIDELSSVCFEKFEDEITSK